MKQICRRSVFVSMRKPRELKEDAEYHVVARANRQEFILDSDEMKELLLEIIKRAKKKFRFQVRTFCIMSNHLHVIIKPGKRESLSKIMQWILSVFAIRFNKKYGLRGHVWYDRFKSTILHSLQQMLHAFRYIALNPVKARIVQNCYDYAYNGVTFLRENVHDLVEPPDYVTRCCLSMLPEQTRVPDGIRVANRNMET